AKAAAAAIAARLPLAGAPAAANVRRVLMDSARDGGTPPQATVLAEGIRVAAPLAASINALDACLATEEDLVAVPAFATSLAVAELVGANREKWLSAFALGAEISIRLSRSLGSDARPFIRAGAVGQVGAALAASRLLALSDEQTGHA